MIINDKNDSNKILPNQLKPGDIYSWDTLGAVFSFRPNYFSAAGGIIPRHEIQSVLLITHPDGAKSFDYNDYWDGNDLIYTGRGKTGDQSYEKHNRYVGENEHQLFVFEAGCGSRKLKFLGKAECKEMWWDHGPDSEQRTRKVLRFRLRFLNSSNQNPPSSISEAIGWAKSFGSKESEAHKTLKEYIANNPEIIGLPKDCKATLEYSFKSPDRADIVFTLASSKRVAVEIELKGAQNTLIGAWQAVKYRTLLCLEAEKPILSPDYESILVANEIPNSTRIWCECYGVKWVEVTIPNNYFPT